MNGEGQRPPAPPEPAQAAADAPEPEPDAAQMSLARRLRQPRTIVSLVVPLASPDGGGGDRLRLPFVHDAGTMAEGVQRLARAWRAYSPELRAERTSLIV